MDIRIGIAQSASVIELEMSDDTDRAALKAEIDASLGADSGVLWLTDKRGKDVAVPVARVAFVEIGKDDAERRIGFGA
ncbi:MAG: DUF3107 domain-containing protein [Acidimicrobiales bacterium]